MAVTFTYDDGYDKSGRQLAVRKVIVAWTSDSSGDAAGTSDKIVGLLLKGVTIPTDGPTASYDITLTDSDSVNPLSGCIDDLADRHTTNTEVVEFLLTNGTAGVAAHPAVCSPITVTVANAGNTKSGTLVLYYKVV